MGFVVFTGFIENIGILVPIFPRKSGYFEKLEEQYSCRLLTKRVSGGSGRH